MNPVLAALLLGVAVLLALAASGRLSGLPYEFPSRQRLFAACLLLVAVLAIAVGQPAVLPPEAAPVPVEDLSFAGLFTGHAVLVLFLLAWWRLRRPVRLSRFLHLDGLRPGDFREGLLLGVRVWIVTIAVAVVAGRLLQLLLGDAALAPTGAEQIPEVMLWMVELPIPHKLLVVAVAMTVEEAFFRAFLQSRIGLVPSSLLFAVAHASYGLPTLMLGVFIVSIMLGRDFARHGRLMRVVLGHGVFDAIQLLVVVPYAVRQLQMMNGQ